jgi:hypothetical protein
MTSRKLTRPPASSTWCSPAATHTLFPEKARVETPDVTHWLAIPPLPGDPQWGDSPYEFIEGLWLQPVPQGESQDVHTFVFASS